MNNFHNKKGTIEVITGPMFSGKSKLLIEKVRKFRKQNMKILAFKPVIDNRWNQNRIESRAGIYIDAIAINSSQEIEKALEQNTIDYIAIDETQFLDNGIIHLIQKLAKKSIGVIVSLLDKDFMDKPFRFANEIIELADVISAQKAICFICGEPATTTFRKGNSLNQIEIGDNEYEARCITCHQKGIMHKMQITKS